MLTASAFYAAIYKKVCYNHVDYMIFANKYAKYVKEFGHFYDEPTSN